MRFTDPNDPLAEAKAIVAEMQQRAQSYETVTEAEAVSRLTNGQLTPLVLAIVTRALEAALLQVRSESKTGVRGRMAPIGFHRSEES